MPINLQESQNYILKEVYEKSLENWLSDFNRFNAIQHGWKRPRDRRIRWADVQKGKIKVAIHLEKLPHRYIESECLCWRCRLYRRIDCW